MRQAVRVNGESIDDFIPNDLRHMFYKSADPVNKYQVTNGYGPYDFSTKGLALYLPLWALTLSGNGTFKSVDAYQHTCTQVGALWRPNGRFFDASDDHIAVADNAVLDFTSGDFTIVAWVNISDLTVSRKLWMRGLRDTDGFETEVAINGRFNLRTSQAGANQVTRATVGTITTGSWFLVGFTRVGVAVKTYSQGVDVTDAGATGTHIDPVTASRDGIIGIDQNLSSSPFDNLIGEFWIYSCAFAATEMLHQYNATAWRYQ